MNQQNQEQNRDQSEQQQHPQIDHAEFRVPAADTQGHTARAYFRLQPGHDRDLEALCGPNSWFPYRTKGDIIRHAVQRHLHWLETQAPITSVTKQVDAIIELVREEEFQAEYSQLFDAIAPRVAGLLGDGQVQQARSLVTRIARLMDDMPEGYWKQHHQEELHRRYGYLLVMGDPFEARSLAQILEESQE